jgi:hypothetical protein
MKDGIIYRFKKIYGKWNSKTKTITSSLIASGILLMVISIVLYQNFAVIPIILYNFLNSDTYFSEFLFITAGLGGLIIVGISYLFIYGVRPSKWHWLDALIVPLILIIIFPLITNRVMEVGPDAFILVRSTYLLLLSGMILFSMGVINAFIQPLSYKGQMFYALINFEAACKIGGRTNVSEIPKLLNLLISAIDDALYHYFELSIVNKNEIIEKFNHHLLFEGSEHLLKTNFFSDNDIYKYFSSNVSIEDINLTNEEIRKKENQEYIETIDSLKLILKNFEPIATQIDTIRITIKEKLMNQTQKIISASVAIVTFVISIIPYFFG